jgi:hypothetical protein
MGTDDRLLMIFALVAVVIVSAITVVVVLMN